MGNSKARRVFLREAWFNNIRDTSSLMPTTGRTARRIAKALNIGTDTKVIAELGPGSGPVTEELLKRLPQNSLLIAIEKNPELVKLLKKINDPRLKVVHGDAANIKQILREEKVDAIVSSIPASRITEEKLREIARACRDVLLPDGEILWFNYRWKKLKGVFTEIFEEVGKKSFYWALSPLTIVSGRGAAEAGNGKKAVTVDEPRLVNAVP